MKACSSISRSQSLMSRVVIITASAGLVLFVAGPTWQRASLSLTPLVSAIKTTTLLGRSQLTVDTLAGNYGARLSWKMPGQMKFSTLGVDAGWTRNRDGLIGADVTKPRLLALWTLVDGTSKK